MTHDNPPQQHPPLPLKWGLHGEVEAIALCLQEAGVETSFDTLMGLTGTAFRTHFFRLADNPGMRLGPDPANPNIIWGPRYAWTSLLYNNFGHYESAAYFYGGDMVQRERLSWDELWKVLRFELDAGRPVALYGLSGQDPWRPVLVRHVALSKAPLSLSFPGLEPEVAWTPKGGTPGNIKVVLVRHGETKPYRPSDNVRKREVLRWALRHGTSRRELVYETERFYAVGLAAFEALGAFLDTEIAAELADPIGQTTSEAAQDMGRFLAAITQQWTEARRCGAAFCEAWAHTLDAVPPSKDDGPLPQPALLRLLATDLVRVAEELQRLSDDFAPVLGDPEQAAALVHDAERLRRSAQVVTAAQALERVVLQRMAEVVEPPSS